MTFDTSRSIFDPWKDYSAVVMEQGRVQLDSDWNEWLAELSRRTRAGTLDLVGRAGYPPTTPFAFQITASVTGTTNTLTIGRGRMYVDGLLAENHGDPTKATWDPALAEQSGSPQPPPATDQYPVEFTAQKYWSGQPVPTDTGSYLAYLDVWTRAITWLEDTDLVDQAVAVDTTGRLQTVWQVKLMSVPAGSTWSCATPDSDIFAAPSAGLLTTRAVANTPTGPCCLTDDTGYTGLENQNYRVEIHQGGSGSDTPSLAGATFKWSRDNGSVTTGVTSIAPGTNTLQNSASQLTVLSLGRDQVLGFSPGDWIEIMDDAHELNPQLSGELHKIDSIDVASRTITLTDTLSTFSNGQPTPDSHTRIVRWDQRGQVYKEDGTPWWNLDAPGSDGTIPVPGPDTSLILESGVKVTFSLSSQTGAFNPADFWTFAARTADASVQELTNAPPQGIHHHYTKLSIVTFTDPASYQDCRTPFPTGGDDCGCCCTYTVGDGVLSTGEFSSIQTAINSLPPGGGEVCIRAGQYFENVVIKNASDVVIHGCGPLTRIASASLSGAASTAVTPAGLSGINAVITVVGSSHVELRSLAVEAAADEVGVLLDLAAPQWADSTTVNGPADRATPSIVAYYRGDRDVTLHDLVITASELPAILAFDANLLRITGNRIATADVRSFWPAVSVSGNEIHIEHNWVGLQDAAMARVWLPASVIGDLATDSQRAQTGSGAATAALTNVPLALAGIQIAGPSQDVFVIENEIDGGRRNGITLGSLVLLRTDGSASGTPVGVLPVSEDPCSTTSTLQLPSTNSDGVSLASGGSLTNIQIDRNRIRNTGLCGIGPVGFFDLEQTQEVISVENLSITGNEISSTLLSAIAGPGTTNPTSGYGAICVPDVENLIIRDNTITDFGATVAAEVSGIFVLHAEVAEISRNQVRQTRAWTSGTQKQTASGALQAGVLLWSVTPPVLSSAADYASLLAAPVYQPGVPAVRVEHNVVQVAVGEALEIVGLGPFSVVNNSLSSGGTVTVEGKPPAVTVMIANFGAAPGVSQSTRFSDLPTYSTTAPPASTRTTSAPPSSGAVIFTNNICQLETREGNQTGLASVWVASLDHVLFGDNLCWQDGLRINTGVDALVAARTVQVTSNRFEENFPATDSFGSCLSFGLANITTQNISDHAIWALAPTATLVDTPNLIAP